MTKTEATLAWGGAVKGVLMLIVQLAVLGLAIFSMVTGYIVFGIIVLLVGVPLAMFVADLASGIVLGAIVGVVYLLSGERS